MKLVVEMKKMRRNMITSMSGIRFSSIGSFGLGQVAAESHESHAYAGSGFSTPIRVGFPWPGLAGEDPGHAMHLAADGAGA